MGIPVLANQQKLTYISSVQIQSGGPTKSDEWLEWTETKSQGTLCYELEIDDDNDGERVDLFLDWHTFIFVIFCYKVSVLLYLVINRLSLSSSSLAYSLGKGMKPSLIQLWVK